MSLCPSSQHQQAVKPQKSEDLMQICSSMKKRNPAQSPFHKVVNNEAGYATMQGLWSLWQSGPLKWSWCHMFQDTCSVYDNNKSSIAIHSVSRPANNAYYAVQPVATIHAHGQASKGNVTSTSVMRTSDVYILGKEPMLTGRRSSTLKMARFKHLRLRQGRWRVALCCAVLL